MNITWNWRLLKLRYTRCLIARDNWLFVLGPDIMDSDYGVTLKWGLLEPMGEWKRWKHNWRISFRAPIRIRLR